MGRKFVLIALLGLATLLLLIFKPWKPKEADPPRFFDRLPEADIIGKSNILDLSRSLSGTMYYYKTPFREFLTHEFLLSQGKNYGLDLQRPVFFFVNQNDWSVIDAGIMCIVTDSSKVLPAITKLKTFGNLRDTTIIGERVYYDPKIDVFCAYGNNWLLIYNGNRFKSTLRHILNAKKNEIPPKWRDFLNSTRFNATATVMHFNFPQLREMGVAEANLVLSNDSTSLYFNAEVMATDTLSFKVKPVGTSLAPEEYTRNLLNMHLDIERLRTNPDDPLYKLMSAMSQKIHFPVADFLKTWEGDIALREGGFHRVKERYVESELDEDFNISEVNKYRDVKVPGYSLYLSTNNHREAFLNLLFNKGIMTQDQDGVRFLFSPPLKMKKEKGSLELFTGTYAPKFVQDSICSAYWTHNLTTYQFYLDSTSTKSIYGRITVPLHKLIPQHIPFYE